MKATYPASATPVRLRRCVTGALLVLGLTVGTLATTATPAEAAGAVFTCYTAQYSNFVLPGRIVRLQSKLSNGSVIIVDQQILDAGGCALFIVNPIYRHYVLQTVIDYMDTGSFYGARYQGSSYAAFVWYNPWQSWYSYGSSTNGHALAGDDVWWLSGTVICRGCQL